jgi:sulfate adenylyltransferase subunit 2
MKIGRGEVDLNELEQKSIFIIREAYAQFKQLAVLWSMGKDSTTTLWLCKKAFFGRIPFPVIHIDTSYKFPEIYEFRDRIAKEWNLNLIIAKNEEALKKGMSPKTTSRFNCCTALKTEALKQVIRKYKFDAIIVSIRRDEHEMRSIERYFSPRDKNFQWNIIREKTPEEMKEGDAPFVSLQPVEFAGWDLYWSDFGQNVDHVRVHPLLHWREIDVWRYIKREKIPVNPLYFAKYVEKTYGLKNKRFRSLGCKPCTTPIDSNANTIEEIIKELETTEIEERSGRAQDKEDEEMMRKLRSLGYM